MDSKEFLAKHLLKFLRGAINGESSPSLVKINMDGLYIESKQGGTKWELIGPKMEPVASMAYILHINGPSEEEVKVQIKNKVGAVKALHRQNVHAANSWDSFRERVLEIQNSFNEWHSQIIDNKCEICGKRDVPNRGGVHFCNVLGKFTCKCGRSWVSFRAQLNKHTLKTCWQKCTACLEKVYCHNSWRRCPDGIRPTFEKIHRADLCEGCILYGSCGGFFYQPFMIHDVLAAIGAIQPLNWLNNDDGITCEFMYNDALHKAIVTPHVHIFDNAAGKVDDMLRLMKKKFQLSENPKVNIERVKNWLKTADKSSEDFLGELDNFKTEVIDYDIPCVEFIEHLMMDKMSETLSAEQEGKSKEEELLKKIIWRWRNSHDIEKFLPQIMSVLKKSATLDIPNNVRILLRGIEGIEIPQMESEICTRFFTLSINTDSFKCVKLFCEELYDKLDLGTRPKILLDVIKEKKIAMIKEIMNAMVNSKRVFVCDECFKEVIKNDMVDVAKLIIQRQWHKPTEADYEFSRKLDRSMWTYFSARRVLIPTYEEEDELYLEDDGWDTDNDDGRSGVEQNEEKYGE